MKYQLEVIIAVYHEEENIIKTLKNLLEKIKLKFRILIVYDYENDPTVKVVNENFNDQKVFLIKNKYKEFNGAVKTAFEMCDAEAVILYTAEDHQNYYVILEMFEKFTQGYDIVCASRLMKGGDYKESKEPFIKSILVKLVSFILIKFTNLQTLDPTNGFRLFSRQVIKKFPIQSKKGFTFAIELLAKAYRSNFKITEVPSKNPMRNFGKSKFKYTSIIFYLPWFLHILIFPPKK